LEGWEFTGRLGIPRLSPHLRNALEVRQQHGTARGRQRRSEGGLQRGVQLEHGAEALRGQREVLGSDGAQAGRRERARAQHELAGAAVEHLRVRRELKKGTIDGSVNVFE
jgi:hypothetical protein